MVQGGAVGVGRLRGVVGMGVCSGLTLTFYLLAVIPVASVRPGFMLGLLPLGLRLAFFAFLAVCSVLAALFARRACAVSAMPALAPVSAVLLMLTGLAYPLGCLGMPVEFLHVADYAVKAFVLPVLGLAWAGKYAAMEEGACRVATVSALLTAGVVLLVLAFLPDFAGAVVACLLPLSVLGLLSHSATPAGSAWDRFAAGAPGSSGSAPASHGYLPWKFFAGIACALAGCDMAMGLSEHGGYMGWTIVGVSFAVGAAAAAVIVAFVRTDRGLCRSGFLLVCVLTAAYAISGIVMGDGLDMGEPIKVFHHVFVLANDMTLSAVAWDVLMRGVRGAHDVTRLVTFGLAAVNIGRAVGYAVGLCVSLMPASLSILSIVFFVPAAFLLAGDPYTGQAREEMRASAPSSTAGRIDELSRAYALTPREREVFELWATGYSLAFIADRLYITRNTVKTHVSHIYKKTGTASREELLVMVHGGA